MSQKLTDAELGKWLRNLSNAGYWDLEQEDVDRLQTIADRLERPGVEELRGALLRYSADEWTIAIDMPANEIVKHFGGPITDGLPVKVSVTPAAT